VESAKDAVRSDGWKVGELDPLALVVTTELNERTATQRTPIERRRFTYFLSKD